MLICGCYQMSRRTTTYRLAVFHVTLMGGCLVCCSHANCPIGPKCRNRRMQQPKSSLPRTEVFAEFERGLGVRTIDFIPKVRKKND